MKKVLMFATCNFISSHNDGGRQCSFRNYSVLCQLFGKENVFVCMIDDMEETEHFFTVPAYSNKLQQIWWALGLRNGYSKKSEQKMIQLAEREDFDLIWFDRSTLGGLCKKIRTGAEKIVFFHNVEREYIKNKIHHENKGYLVSYPAFAWNEKQAVNDADKIIGLNTRDSKLLYESYGREADFLLPISFNDMYPESTKVQKTENGIKQLLFVGSYFRPNVEGLDWLVQNVMPLLRDVNLIIVGKGMENHAESWNGNNVQVVGTVQELSEYYLRADAVVLPIFYGDGMKVKTAEALMYGKVIFGTKEAFEGYETVGQQDMIECNTVKEFVDKITLFFKEQGSGYFSKSNRTLFMNQYENQTLVRKLGEFLGV